MKYRRGQSKLDYNDIELIKDCFTKGLSDTEIGQIFNVTRNHINHIRNNRRWYDLNERPQKVYHPTREGETPLNPLKTIQHFMKRWNINMIEYQDICIYLNGKKEE